MPETSECIRTHGEKTAKALVLILSFCLLAYTVIRAYRLPFVHDEGVTYLLYLLTGPSALMDCYSANNHFLNTILMYCSSLIFGNGELALRLPNILFHVVFMAVTFCFVRRLFTNPWLLVCAFLFLNMNPFVLDFFSLARGYGIAMALTMLGIFLFLRGMQEGGRNQKDILSAFWCAGLASFANLSFLNFLGGMLGTYLAVEALEILRRNSHSGFTAIFRQVVTATKFFYKHIILMLLVLVPVGAIFYREKTLYYGGQSGFWHDTVVSLITSSGYDCNFMPLYKALVMGLVIGTAALAVSILFLQLFRRLNRRPSELVLVMLITLITAAAVLVQHLSFGTPYPMDRTALHFLLLFSVTFILLVEYFTSSGSTVVRIAAACILVAVSAGGTAHTLKNANLDHTLIWRYDADVKQMLADLESDVIQQGVKGKISFGISWTFEPSINYYYAVRQPPWLPIVTREGIKADYDYYYVRPDDMNELTAKNVRILVKYPLTGNVLARKIIKSYDL